MCAGRRRAMRRDGEGRTVYTVAKRDQRVPYACPALHCPRSEHPHVPTLLLPDPSRRFAGTTQHRSSAGSATHASAESQRHRNRLRVRRRHLGRLADWWRGATHHLDPSGGEQSALLARRAVDRLHVGPRRHSRGLRRERARRRAAAADVVSRRSDRSRVDERREPRPLRHLTRHGAGRAQSPVDRPAHRRPVHAGGERVGKRRFVLARRQADGRRPRDPMGRGVAQLPRWAEHPAPPSQPRLARRSAHP